MTTQTLFRSLKSQPVSVGSNVGQNVGTKGVTNDADALSAGRSTDNVQSISSRAASTTRWSLFQSINAKAWEPSPPLTVEEKLNRRVAVQSQANLFESGPKIRLPKMSSQLAQGLRNMGLSAGLKAPLETPIPVAASAISPASAQTKPETTPATPTRQVTSESPINSQDPLAVFRSRSSKLFMQTTQAEPTQLTGSISAPTIDASLLVSVFERLAMAKSNVTQGSPKPRQSLRSTLGALSRQRRDSL